MVLVIAHRGASAQKPENTLAAFARARELGADWVELDVRRSADGALVVHHDAVLPDGRPVASIPARDLPPEVVSLGEALEELEGLGVNIEIKNNAGDPDLDRTHYLAKAVVGLLSLRGGRDEVLISSFNPRTTMAVRALDPSLRIGHLCLGITESEIALLAAQGYASIHPYYTAVSEEMCQAARLSGVAAYPWTIDDPAEMRRLIDHGVDGIITNEVDTGRAVVDGSL